jgi:hypothetical protein
MGAFMKYRYCNVVAFLSFVACAQNAVETQAAPPGGGQPPLTVTVPGTPVPGTPVTVGCTPPTDPKCPAAVGAAVKATDLPAEGTDPFRGLKWGLGIAMTSSLGGVGTVTIDPTSKVVHVTKLNSSAARGAFELHYFFKFCNEIANGGFIHLPRDWPTSGGGPPGCPERSTQFGMGPFVSLNTSPFDTSGTFASKVFDSVGAGWMIGLNAYDNQTLTSTLVHSLNFGIGAVLDTSVRQLANGVQDGQVTAIAPTNQDLLTTQTTKIGWMAILSYRLFEVNLK